MKKVILFICCFPFFLYSQSGFNNLYKYESPSALYTGVINHNDTLITSGVIYNDTLNKWLLLIEKIDSNGTIIQTVLKIDPDGDNFNTINTDIISTSDNGVLITGHVGSSIKAFTLKLNEYLEEEFYTIHYDSTVRTLLQREAIEVSDGYIIGSDIQMQSYDNQAWAMKLDYEGNEVWHHQYGAADTSEIVLDMEVTAGGNVIFAGYKTIFDSSAPEDFWVKPWSLIIDAATGEVIEEKVYDIYAPERVAYTIYSMPDGTYLTGGVERVNELGPSFRGKLSIRHLDNEGNLIWKKNYGPDTRGLEYYIYKIMPLNDNKFVAVGRGSKEEGEIKCAITICFNPENGEEYWVRTDTIPIDTINNTNNYVQGATVLSSGSIAVAGYNNTNGRSYAWLLKMDRNGCIQEDCDTYVGLASEPEAVLLPVLYPNPAGSYFRIQGNHEGNIHIYNLNGQHIKTVAEHLTFEEIEVSSFPEGLYFVRGQTKGRVWVLKLVR